MSGILEQIGNFLNTLGPLIVLPIVITILGLILGLAALWRIRNTATKSS